jgi:hypothetical protein
LEGKIAEFQENLDFTARYMEMRKQMGILEYFPNRKQYMC